MILTKAPFRISFIGGGSDYPSVFSAHQGAVLSCTLDMHVYCALLPLAEHAPEKIRFTYSKSESVSRVEELEHPAVREALLKMGWDTPINIATFADIPSRTGLGGSSSFTVALLSALHAMRDIPLSPKELAMSAIDVERVRCAEPGGWQDQFSASFGGFRLYKFAKENVEVSENILPAATLNEIAKSFFLTPIPKVRKSDQASKTQTKLYSSSAAHEAALLSGNMALKVSSQLDSSLSLTEIVSMLGETVELSQKLKNEFSETDVESGLLMERAKSAGAIGSKIAGAGGGGYILSVVPLDRSDKFHTLMKGLKTFNPGLSIDGAKVANLDWQKSY